MKQRQSRTRPLLAGIVPLILFGAFLLPERALATPASITYTYDHHIFTIAVAAQPEWKAPERAWFFLGKKAIPPAALKTCGNDDTLPEGWTTTLIPDWNIDAIERTLQREIGDVLHRIPGSVAISLSLSGSIAFDGQGLPGRMLDTTKAAMLTKHALEENITNIVLPVTESPPTVVVDDPRLVAIGIKEVVMVGESVFARSPVNRRHNIAVGLSKFNGHIIPQGEVFSFNEVLGPVNAETGYRKELVIQGDETLPDYGGGLCQVSSTAYRGPWEYGLPIVQRKNHSYAVSYYSPQGTDATIYPPNIDMKFTNDTPGALLIQSFSDDDSRAYFIYYGTRDDREAEVFGPYISNRRSAPKEERISYTTDIPPGEKRKAGERHDGMNALWYRTVRMPGTGAILERFFSSYQARPLYWQVGVTAAERAKLTEGESSEAPSWLPSKL